MSFLPDVAENVSVETSRDSHVKLNVVTNSSLSAVKFETSTVILKSQRGGVIYNNNGFLYNQKRGERRDGSYNAVCIYYARGCYGRACFTPTGELLCLKRQHNHDPATLHPNNVNNGGQLRETDKPASATGEEEIMFDQFSTTRKDELVLDKLINELIGSVADAVLDDKVDKAMESFASSDDFEEEEKIEGEEDTDKCT